MVPVPTASRTAAALLAGCCLIFVSCNRAADPDPEARFAPTADEFSLMTYNVLQFGYEDRNHDGQKNDFKPDDQIAAVMKIITRVHPDVLAIQELGDQAAFDVFRQDLARQGLTFADAEFLPSSSTEANMAVLSRFPIVSRQPITNETYSIGDQEVPVSRGFIDVDIQVNPEYRFRLMVAHLKSKLFNPLGQTEMRRNEARLLNKHLRRDLDKTPDLNLAVVGDMNDSISSAALHELVGEDMPNLYDLRPRDYLGDVWTHFWASQELYERIDYVLVSTGMLKEAISGKTHAVRDPLTYRASDHRPVVAVFKARDQ